MKKQNNYADKPYNRCLACHHREAKRCDGPRTSAMELPRWCEFMRDMKEANKLTNSYIAEKSGVSIKTIERLMALNSEQDIMRETARRIEDAIIGSSNQYPCYLAFEETLPNNSQQLTDATRELERVLADNEDYRVALDNIHASYNAEILLVRDDGQKRLDESQKRLEEAQKMIDFLLEELKLVRADAEHWRFENDRKGRLIDAHLEKIVAK